MKNLKDMGLNELQSLKIEIENIIQERKKESANEFTFQFNATCEPRKHGKPYVARLYWENGKLQREFMELDYSYGKYEATAFGEYTASVGDIIEKRSGSSWKNDYRDWYYINELGDEINVANIYSSSEKTRVTLYLQNKITNKELLQGR